MKQRIIVKLLSLLFFTVFFFGIAWFFDRQCATSCVGEALASNVSNSMNLNFTFTTDEQSGSDDSMSINLNDAAGELGSDEDNPERVAGPLEVVLNSSEKLRIKSYVTNWRIVESSADQLSVAFKKYLEPQEWSIKESQEALEIFCYKKGPTEAELRLPQGFKGELEIISVAGSIAVIEIADTAKLKLTNVSGEISMKEAPSQELTIKTVSGDVALSPPQTSADLKLTFNSVSGELDFRLLSPMKALNIETVSGSVSLSVGPAVGFNFAMQGMSSNFKGLPANTENSSGFMHESLKGQLGAEPKGELNFESVSGDFNLKQVEIN